MQRKNKNNIKLALDILMALFLAILFNKAALGGLAFHEIAGLAVGAFIIFHMLSGQTYPQENEKDGNDAGVR